MIITKYQSDTNHYLFIILQLKSYLSINKIFDIFNMFDTNDNLANKYFVNHKKFFVTYKNRANSIKGSFTALGIDLKEAQEVAAMSIQMEHTSEKIEQFEIELQEMTGGVLEEIMLQISSLFRF